MLTSIESMPYYNSQSMLPVTLDSLRFTVRYPLDIYSFKLVACLALEAVESTCHTF
jgi:hypothetical protein